MFRMLKHPSSEACDLFVELFHGFYCSGSMCVGVTLWFGWGGVVSGCRLQLAAGMGMRRIRLANLPPEVNERSIRAALASYGEIVSIQDEIWPKAYRYKVANRVKVIMMKLVKDLPSEMNIAGHRALPSYDGQPVTCYGCGDSGHINQTCPKRHGGGMVTSDMPQKAWRRYGNIRHAPKGVEEVC